MLLETTTQNSVCVVGKSITFKVAPSFVSYLSYRLSKEYNFKSCCRKFINFETSTIAEHLESEIIFNIKCKPQILAEGIFFGSSIISFNFKLQFNQRILENNFV